MRVLLADAALNLRQALSSLFDVSVPASAFSAGTIAAALLSESDDMRGTAIADQLLGFDGDDVIRGFGGDDYAWGGNGDDFILGGDGADALTGADDLDGGTGGDTLLGKEYQKITDES